MAPPQNTAADVVSADAAGDHDKRGSKPKAVYTWEEIAKHNNAKDCWFVVDGLVYNVNGWKKHPGGNALYMYAGEDASDGFEAFHKDRKFAEKYMKAFCIGRVENPDENVSPFLKEFREMREKFQEAGLFKANLWFYVLQYAIAFAWVAAASYVLEFGTSFFYVLVSGIIFGGAQTQYGWLMHDCGHLSVLESPLANRNLQIFTKNVLLGGSAGWWQDKHNRHHAKPNVLGKDPDIATTPLFAWDEYMAKELGWKFTKYQKYYWPFLGPPLTMFHMQYLGYRFKLKHDLNIEWVVYLFGHWPLYYILFGHKLSIGMWLLHMAVMRIVQGNWFIWVVALNHFPMQVIKKGEDHYDWPTIQLLTTQNVEDSTFMNWLTGHLNHQIEHHWFPTMPRHNYPKVAPLVKALCKKHNVAYGEKPAFAAVKHVFSSLEDASGILEDVY